MATRHATFHVARSHFPRGLPVQHRPQHPEARPVLSALPPTLNWLAFSKLFGVILTTRELGALLAIQRLPDCLAPPATRVSSWLRPGVPPRPIGAVLDVQLPPCISVRFKPLSPLLTTNHPPGCSAPSWPSNAFLVARRSPRWSAPSWLLGTFFVS